MRTQKQKEQHREEMRKLRKTPAYRLYNRNYMREYRRKHFKNRKRLKTYSFPTEPLHIVKEEKVSLP
jgi:hypothetical protein